jgi:hypothetical protein
VPEYKGNTMNTRDRMTILCVLALTGGLMIPGLAAAADAPAAAAPVTVLSNESYARVFRVFKTPVLITKSGEIQVAPDPAAKEPKPLAEFQSPLPESGWIKPEFIDNSWERQKSPVEMALPWAGGHASLHTASANALICLRWKFLVDDPAKVDGLTLSAEYVGGMAIFVNGTEWKRASLPAGELKTDTLAEKYPDDLTVMPDGKFVQPNYPNNPLPPEQVAKVEERYRKLDPVVVPAKLLKAGVNVLAIEIHRAPVNEAAILATRKAEGAMSTRPGLYPYAGLRKIALTSASGAGVSANVARPPGVQVWSVPSYATVRSAEYDETPGQASCQPVAIHGVRNGVFSGRVIVSSGAAIQGFRATASDLVQSGGAAKISGTAIALRHAEPSVEAKNMRVPRDRFDGLSEKLPSEVALLNKAAMCQLWLTVRIPKDARPGRYNGTVTIQAEGLKPAVVPIELTVYGWNLPDPVDFHLHNFGYLAEDAVCGHYNVPRWSDKHFELMGKSMALMAEINSRQAIVNLAISFYGGNKGEINCSNKETIIRWIRQADGSFKYDFTLFDKYLDLVAKSMGKPTLLRVNCWNEVAKKNGVIAAGFPSSGVAQNMSVSLLDPATGKVEPMEQPTPGTEESFKFWQPVLAEVRKKVEARGWWDVTALGWSSYCYNPIAEVVSVAKRIWPDGVWSYTAHNGTRGGAFSCVEKGENMRVLQSDAVWTVSPLKPRGYRELLKPHYGYWCYTWRSAMREYGDLAIFRIIGEDEIMRGMDGVSDFGVDLFPVKSESGRYYVPGNGRGTGGPNDSILALLAPGPDGAISSERFEMMREGMQIAEAILYLQLALDAKKLSPELEQKVNDCLTERGECYMRNWTAGRQERDRRLLALTEEVAR